MELLKDSNNLTLKMNLTAKEESEFFVHLSNDSITFAKEVFKSLSSSSKETVGKILKWDGITKKEIVTKLSLLHVDLQDADEVTDAAALRKIIRLYRDK